MRESSYRKKSRIKMRHEKLSSVMNASICKEKKLSFLISSAIFIFSLLYDVVIHNFFLYRINASIHLEAEGIIIIIVVIEMKFE